ncbi:hypothetical protein M5D96_008634, partial [Drosophila gunungcola]
MHKKVVKGAGGKRYDELPGFVGKPLPWQLPVIS